jgi:hypothetical protein
MLVACVYCCFSQQGGLTKKDLEETMKSMLMPPGGGVSLSTIQGRGWAGQG